MPDNPERDIEKQLRASAEQRRAEAGEPFELHEATRLLLQSEVARQYGKPKDRPDATRAWWLVLWPRFAVGTALAAVLGFGVWLTLAPPVKERTLAMDSATKEKNANRADDQPGAIRPSARPTEIAESPAPTAPRPEPAPTLARSRDDSKKSDPPLKLELADQTPPQSLSSTKAAESTPASAATPSPAPATAALSLEIASARQKAGGEQALNDAFAPAGSSGGRGGFAGGGSGGGLARQSALQSSTTEAGNIARKDASDSTAALGQTRATVADSSSVTSDLAALTKQQASRANQNVEPSTWYFRNQAVPADGRAGAALGGRGPARALAPTSPVARAVLNNFRVEQSGDALRIVDEDGSVYTGRLQPAAVIAERDAAKSFDSRTVEQARAPRLTAEMKLADQPQQIAPVNFNVSGLNRSLSQQVVFTGQWQQVVLLNAVSNQTGAFFVATQAGVDVPQSNRAFTQSQLAPNINQQQRVVGRARLEDAREFRVDALSVGQ